MITIDKGVTCVYNDNKELVAIVHKDEKTHDNIIHATPKMNMDEMKQFLTGEEGVLLKD